MSQEIEAREKDREEFLHAEDSAKWPFPMELNHGAKHRRITSESTVCHNMLASVIAFGRARPEHEPEKES
jgi:hypothetical protein